MSRLRLLVAVTCLTLMLSGCVDKPTGGNEAPDDPVLQFRETIEADTVGGDVAVRIIVLAKSDGVCRAEWSAHVEPFQSKPRFVAWASSRGQETGSLVSVNDPFPGHAHAGPADTRLVDPYGTASSVVFDVVPAVARGSMELRLEAAAPLEVTVGFAGVVPRSEASSGGMNVKLECSVAFEVIGRSASKAPLFFGSVASAGGAGAHASEFGYANVADGFSLSTDAPIVDFLMWHSTGTGSYALSLPDRQVEWMTTMDLSVEVFMHRGGPGDWSFEFTRVGHFDPMVGAIVPLTPIGSWDALEESA